MRTEDRQAREEAGYEHIANRAMAPLEARIAELEAQRLALVRQIDAVVWNFEHGTVTAEEHERAWRNVHAVAIASVTGPKR